MKATGRFHILQRTAIVTWFSLSLAASVQARDIFVSNTLGDDLATGLLAYPDSSGSGPVKTISRALRLARAGDQIIMQDTGVPYRESFTLGGAQHSGREARPFAIYGNGAVLDGTVPIPNNFWEHYKDRIFRFHPRRQTHLQVFYEGKPLVENRPSPQATEPPELKPLEWCLFRGDVYFHAEEGKLPDAYQLTQTGARFGITLYRVHDVIVDGLTIQGYQVDGVNAHDQVVDVRLSGLTSRGNGRSGISVGGVSSVVIERCLVGDNSRAQVRVESPARVKVFQSQVLDNSAPPFAVEGGTLTVNGRPWSADR